MKLKHDVGGKIRGFSQGEANTVVTIDNEIPVSGSSVIVTSGDVDLLETIADGVENTFSLVCSNSCQSVSEDLAVATVTGAQIRRVADGIAKIKIVDTKGIAKKIEKKVSLSGAATVQVFNNFKTGTLAAHLQANIDALVLSETPANLDVQLNSGAVGNVVKNPLNIISANYDDSGLSYYNNSNTGMAVSPRHILTARHVNGGSARTLYFVTTTGEVISRQATSHWSTYGMIGDQDLGLSYLDADLPANVTPLKILPADWKTKMPDRAVQGAVAGSDMGQPPAFIHMNNSAKVGVVAFSGKSPASVDVTDGIHVATHNQHSQWRPGGASSTIVTLPINGELVLCGSYYYKSQGWDEMGMPDFSQYISILNTAMTTMHGSAEHQLQTVDLSGFPTI